MAQSPEERRVARDKRLAERSAKRKADLDAGLYPERRRSDDLVLSELREEWESWNKPKSTPTHGSHQGDSHKALEASKIVGEVRALCTNISKKYKANTYSENERSETPTGHRWDKPELEDLFARAFDWLFGAAGKTNQFTYAFDNAETIQHWRRLISRQIDHMLAHRTNKTNIDNYVERAKKLLLGPPFKSCEIEGTAWYGLGSRPEPDRDDRSALQANDSDRVRRSEKFANARRRVSLVERKTIRKATDRAPSIWDNSQLTLCLEGIGRCYPHGFTLMHVEQLFKEVFTFLNVPGLSSMETDNSVTENEGDDVFENLKVDLHRADHTETERRALAGDTVRILLDGFTETDLEILRRHANGEGLERIGLDLDIGSRPTVTNRLNSIKETLRERGIELLGTESTQEDIVADLNSVLLTGLVRGVPETDPSP